MTYSWATVPGMDIVGNIIGSPYASITLADCKTNCQNDPTCKGIVTPFSNNGPGNCVLKTDASPNTRVAKSNSWINTLQRFTWTRSLAMDAYGGNDVGSQLRNKTKNECKTACANDSRCVGVVLSFDDSTTTKGNCRMKSTLVSNLGQANTNHTLYSLQRS
jgi:hypothetical protein